jgi:hypothetical protein
LTTVVVVVVVVATVVTVLDDVAVVDAAGFVAITNNRSMEVTVKVVVVIMV